MKPVRVRFAPSPTGALHIGGIRTALYNYLFARKHGGKFVLRLEDTDRTRFVPQAETYIKDALDWCGLQLDEGPDQGGSYGPYRQSERKEIYKAFAEKMIANGNAYFAIDTPEELNAMREAAKAAGNHSFKYDHTMRINGRNSLSLDQAYIKEWVASEKPYTIRLKIPEKETITFTDIVRGEVSFKGSELDDKILLKTDGMPTYHLANIVDDFSMKISHVIRGEEWLSSTAHHVLMYRALNLEDHIPQFAHIPLILKPTGKGKLSKRDGSKFGFPVFPLSWNAENPEDSFEGFREAGFLPEALINFLAFLGWNPGTEQEIFSMDQLIEAFSLNQIGKSGARFDYDKALWFNQHYLIGRQGIEIAKMIRNQVSDQISDSYLSKACDLMKERVHRANEVLDKGYFLFEPVKEYDQKNVRKRWKPENQSTIEVLLTRLEGMQSYDAQDIETMVKQYLEETGLKFGDVLPVLRLGLAGIMNGPSIFDMMALIGADEVRSRMTRAFSVFNQIKKDAIQG
ncbi:MAG: glutamate--tRNA ligase [Bacteroidia bacterium]|nr:glutamate--tRNA ligase [Bacteroidia bacterium]